MRGCRGGVIAEEGEVLGEGLEPTLLAEPDPKSGASANFATRAGEVGKVACGRSGDQPSMNSKRRTRQAVFGHLLSSEVWAPPPSGTARLGSVRTHLLHVAMLL